MEDLLLILDSSNLIHRAYHNPAFKGRIFDKNNNPAWLGIILARKLQEAVKSYNPKYIVSCEDRRSNALLRRKIYDGYKSARVGNKEDDLTLQFQDATDIIQALGIPQVSYEGYEADDIISNIVNLFKHTNLRIVVITGDKDLLQLVDSQNDVEVHLNNNKVPNNPLHMEHFILEDDVIQKHGVPPKLIPDLFGLIGDVSDGIPSIPGISAATGANIFSQGFQSLDDLYTRLDYLQPTTGVNLDQLKSTLILNKKQAYLSKWLASPLPIDLSYLTLANFRKSDDPIPLLKYTHDRGLEKWNNYLGYETDYKQMVEYMSLMTFLINCNQEYYLKGKSSISDYEFDKLLEELKELEITMNYKHPKTPTNNVGSDLMNHGKSVPHDVPMLSIDNVYSPTELHKWITSIQKDYPEAEFIVEHKWDGISLAAKYKDGLLYQAVTRGDGLAGNDVTANAKMLMNLPHRIEGFTGEIRGEVVIDLNDFIKLNIERLKNREEEFSNPRNTASIISSGKNPEEIKKRFMQFKPFGIIAKNTPAATELLREHNIIIPGIILKGNQVSLDSLTSFINSEEINKKHKTFPTDGLVIKVVQSSIREALGENNKFVKWARAYKFNPEGGITKLLDVEWSLGRTGALTPVGIVEPVELSGSVVSRMSMHNMDMIQGYNVKIGDIVVIAKAAEIIPQLVKVENAIGKIEIVPPESCPCCGTPIIKVGVEHVCPNDECSERVKRYLEYVVSKDILDLKHFGPAVISLLYSRGVRKVEDLFKLSFYDGLENVEGYGEKMKELLLVTVKLAKEETELYRIIASLGIELVAKNTSKKIASVNTIENMINGNINLNLQLGNVVKGHITNYFRKYPDAIKRISEEVRIINTENIIKSGKLVGKTFCISGQLPSGYTKDKLEKVIKENGGIMVNGVSQQTSYLICEDQSFNKAQKAKKYGIPILTVKEFLKLTKGA